MNDGVDRSPITAAELAEARRYPMVIAWSDEDDAFLVTSPDLPGVRTHGTTREEAVAMGEELFAVWLSASRDLGEAVPLPSGAYRGLVVERPPTYDAAHIRQIRHRLDVSQRVFAAMLNVSLGTVRSWEQGTRSPDGASLRLLDIAARRPDALLEPVGADGESTLRVVHRGASPARSGVRART